MRSYFWAVPVLAGVALFFSVRWLVGSLPDAHIDLEVYRFGVEAWWRDGDIYGPLPPTTGGAELPFIYPPFALLVLSPLAILPFDAAVVSLFVVSFLCLAVTLYVVTRQAWPSGGARGAIVVSSAALPLTVFLEPVAQTFEFGQVSLILMAVIAVDCLAPKTWWPRGLGVGIVAAIKLTPLAFLLFFLVRKDYRAAITTVVTAVVASAIGFVVDFGASTAYWFGGLAGAAGVSGSAFRTNQTIEATLTRMNLSDGVTKVLWLVLVAVLVVLVAAAMRRSEPVLALMANAGLGLVASPTSWSHYWVWAVPAMLVMAGYAARRWRERSYAMPGWIAAALLTAVVCYLAPFHQLPPSGFPVVKQHWTVREQLLGASYVLLGVGLLLAYALPRLRGKRAPAPKVTPATLPADAATP
ncbi:glycosyltransferase 87 family protein [Amycolatopsis nigrescens]|uniref:glycosyltransferase 87 family protein n=1 Tax=Amycolatopsis nigrescens TaxID=381445 RepID=UPI0005906DC5|nr:glycosyltransferase 87 family protein [Amycolatopsis nigrescens]